MACDPYFSGPFPQVHAGYGSIGWSDYSPLRYMHDVDVSSESTTSNVGSDEDNMLLSEQRAESVKSALVAKGVASDRIS